jgi:hypothetical protein
MTAGLSSRRKEREDLMAKPNYAYEKRQRELEKKKKKEDKALKKTVSPDASSPDSAGALPESDARDAPLAEPPAA